MSMSGRTPARDTRPDMHAERGRSCQPQKIGFGWMGDYPRQWSDQTWVKISAVVVRTTEKAALIRRTGTAWVPLRYLDRTGEKSRRYYPAELVRLPLWLFRKVRKKLNGEEST